MTTPEVRTPVDVPALLGWIDRAADADDAERLAILAVRIVPVLPALCDELVEARARIALLEKDSARLDALEAWAPLFVDENGFSDGMVEFSHGYEDDPDEDDEAVDEEGYWRQWSVTGGKDLDGFGTAVGEGKTLREAIDDAASRSKPTAGAAVSTEVER